MPIDKSVIAEPQALREQIEAQKTHAGTCPSCGHCPTCGRSGHQLAPVYPLYPVNPWYPNYPYIVYCGDGVGSGVTTSTVRVTNATSLHTSGNLTIS